MTEQEELDCEMRPEYDFAKGRRNPYAARAMMPTRVIVLHPDLQEIFPDSESVNAALRLLVQVGGAATHREAADEAKAS